MDKKKIIKFEVTKLSKYEMGDRIYKVGEMFRYGMGDGRTGVISGLYRRDWTSIGGNKMAAHIVEYSILDSGTEYESTLYEFVRACARKQTVWLKEKDHVND